MHLVRSPSCFYPGWATWLWSQTKWRNTSSKWWRQRTWRRCGSSMKGRRWNGERPIDRWTETRLGFVAHVLFCFQICSMLEEQVIIFFKYRISFSSHQEYIFIFLLVALGEIPSSGSANPLPPHKNLHHITTGTISRKLDRCCVSYLLVSLKINKVSISP